MLVLVCSGLGCRLVLVCGTQYQIDGMLKERSLAPKYVGGYRITDRETLRMSIEAAGQVRTQCEQFLSRVRVYQPRTHPSHTAHAHAQGVHLRHLYIIRCMPFAQARCIAG